jgi:methyl-accepting chemotaxis protein
MRSKSEQVHQSVKEIKKRIYEINKILEFTHRIKNQVNEGEMVKYSKYTEQALNQISNMVAEMYGNVKKLKNS